ncbi:MAG: transcription termination factor NusA [Candidatus Kerfeldbacteria bacterium]
MAKENEIVLAVKQICEEKNISFESVIETIEAALAVAYRKDFGEKNQNIKVEFDIETADASVFDVKKVVTDEIFEVYEKLREEKLAEEAKEAADAEKGIVKKEKKPTKVEKKEEIDDEEEVERFNPKTDISLSEAKKIKKSIKLEGEIKTALTPPAAYGRMAAQTAKQVIVQRLREAERENIYKEFKDKEGDVINGTIQRVEGRMVLVDLGPTTALLPPPEQVPMERYNSGQRFKFYVVAVNETPKGPEIILSRSHVEMVKKLFMLEVPEIGNGSVEIKSIAREAGSRTKLAVFTTQKNIDPVGSCVGQRGARVQTIISEIGGEKIDIVEWDEDPVKFITNSLSPAKVLGVNTNEEEKTAKVEVKEDQLSLAIGKAGQNVRLSAKLTGWKIDIISEAGIPAIPKEELDDKDEDIESEEEIEKKEEPKDLAASLPTGQASSEEVKEEEKKDVKEEEVVEEKKEDKEK